MKKVLILLVLLLLLTGCSSKNIKEVVEKGIEDYKATSLENINKLVNDDDITKDYSLAFLKKITEFDYEIKDQTINSDSATVKVIIKTIDLAEFVKEISGNKDIISLSEKVSLETDETKIKEYIKTLVENINEIAINYPCVKETELEIPCISENNEWIIDPSYDLNSNLSSIILATSITIGE